MPKRRTDDVVHVVMTDHLIQRRPPSRDLLADLKERHPLEADEYHGEVVPYYSASDPLYRALAQVAQKNNLHTGIVELARQVESRQPREPEWYLQLGDAWLADGESGKAVAAYEQGVLLAPQIARAFQSLAQGLKISGQMESSGKTLQRAIQIAPSDARSWYQLATINAALGRGDDALTDIQKAVALDPDLPGVYTTLASIAAAAGERGRADAALREALRIDPYDAAAWDFAGRSRAERNQFAEAFFDFEKALLYRPGFGSYLYDYALTLASAGQFYRAEEFAQAAARADNSLPEPHALLGRILARRRQMTDASKEYREAVRLKPDFAQARLDLASILISGGERAQAVEQLREVAKGKDPVAAQLANATLQRLGEP